MPYTAPTLTEAQTALSQRLNDPDMVRWVPDELTIYLREALRVWNAWTAHWRDQGSFATAAVQPFYDLPTVLPTIRPYTVTNWELIADLQYALLEPAAAGGTWTGTDQFDLTKLTDAIQDKCNAFLRETGAVLTFDAGTPQTLAASGRAALDEAVLIVRRATWKPTATQLDLPLTRADEWAADHYQPTWPVDGADEESYAYSVTAVPPLFLQVIPPPTAEGTLSLVSVNKVATIDPTVSAVIRIPTDWMWVIKYGALSDLLQNDGLALDPARSAYCEQRWQQGIEMAKKMPVVLTARIDDVVTITNGLADLDSYQPLWQLVAGQPLEVGMAGSNLLCTVPPAGSNLYTVTLDVVRNAPVPALPTDILQISADVFDSILDYAQHAALFKEGGGQLQLAQALLDRAASAAGVELAVQQASQPARRPLLRQQRQDEDASPRELEPAPAE